MFKPITKQEFQQKTGIGRDLLCPAWEDADIVTSLRDMVKIISLGDMPKQYLRALIDSIAVAGDCNHFPYRGKKIDLVRIDPQHLRIGQTFVQNDKILGLLGSFKNLFWDFTGPRGYAGLTAKIVLGQLSNGDVAVAHYLPPIVEEHGSTNALLDGVHRQFAGAGIGVSVESILIRDMDTDFPAGLQKWRDIKQVDVKPDRADRFINLKEDLFRDLKAIGVDG